MGLPRGGQAPCSRPFESFLISPASRGLRGGQAPRRPAQPPTPSAGFPPSRLNWRQQPWQLLYSKELTLVQRLTKGRGGTLGKHHSFGIRDRMAACGFPSPGTRGVWGAENSVVGLVSCVTSACPLDPSRPASSRGLCKPEFLQTWPRCPRDNSVPSGASFARPAVQKLWLDAPVSCWPTRPPTSQSPRRFWVLEGKRFQALVRPLGRGDST